MHLLPLKQTSFCVIFQGMNKETRWGVWVDGTSDMKCVAGTQIAELTSLQLSLEQLD